MRHTRPFHLVLSFAAALALSACATVGTPAPSSRTLEGDKALMRNVLTLPRVVFLDADESIDAVVVGISDPAAEASVRAFAANRGVAAAGVKTVAAKPFRRFASLRDNIRPVMGGLQIRNGDHNDCTMTVAVFNRSRSKKGLLTNSHCTRAQGSVDGISFYQPGGGFLGNDAVGREVIDPAMTGALPGCPDGRLCRLSDAAYVEFDNGLSGVVGKIARPAHLCHGTAPCDQLMNNPADALAVTGLAANPSRGEFRHKIGRTTGWTQGLVSRTCVDANVEETNFTFLCQYVVGAAGGHGDSGSPVFELMQGDRAVLSGILWGGPDDGSLFIYSPIDAVESELGAFDFF